MCVKFSFSFNFEFKILLQFDGAVHFKPYLSRNYIPFFSYKNLDACALTKWATEFQVFRPFILFINESMQGVIRECPYLGWISIENGSLNLGESKTMEELERTQVSNFPNGNYKILIQLFNKRDLNIFNVSLFFDIYTRSNVLSDNVNI